MSTKRLILNDGLGISRDSVKVSSTPNGIWNKTEVVYGYGYHDGGLNKSYLDEEIGLGENTVTISGVQSAFQYLFGVHPSIAIDSLYNSTKNANGENGIGLPDQPVDQKYNFYVPDHSIETDPLSGAAIRTPIYNPGQFVQLFGVGVTGTAENNITVHKVGYRETSINMNGDPNGIMYPFRYTASELDPAEKTKYFGKKSFPDGATGYYLKRFESISQPKHVWKTRDTMDDDNEIEATNNDIWDRTRNDAILSFVEMHLQITKKDLKEFFADNLEQPESTRFNCIALYDGLYIDSAKGTELFGDYANVRLFSKLNIPTEHLSLQKDLEIIYRVYGS